MHTEFLWGNLKERDRLEIPGVGWRIILRWIFRKLEGKIMVWIEVTRDKHRWRAVVNAVLNLRFP